MISHVNLEQCNVEFFLGTTDKEHKRPKRYRKDFELKFIGDKSKK